MEKEDLSLQFPNQRPLAHLFDTVKILTDDPQLRTNRIALLQKVFAPFQEPSTSAKSKR